MRLVPYAHLGTGNYHPRTTRLYTDFGLLTADPAICADVNEVFMHITSLAKAGRLKRLLLAPFTMHRRVIDMIRRETKHARDGQAGAHRRQDERAARGRRDPRAATRRRRRASTIDLIVRGACALRPGVRGLSENIRVRSILGRFLEHHRVWYFANAGDADVWLVVGRLDGPQPVPAHRGRVPGARHRLLRKRVVDEGLLAYLADTRDAWKLRADGSWAKARAARPRAAALGAIELLARMREPDERTELMDLMLWRHAEAEPGEPDLGRRLTAKGVKQAERMGAWLDRHLPDTARILVSPADRAQQTALALKRKFRPWTRSDRARSVAAVLAAAELARLARGGRRRRSSADARRGRVVPALRRGSVLVGQQRRRLVAFESRPTGASAVVLRVVIAPDFV